MAGKQVTELDALPSFTDNSLLPVHNGAGLKKGTLTQLSNYLGTKFSNPNLLINPDFKINQRGQSTYSSSKEIYTVDRWSMSNATTIVNSDGTITISSLSGSGYCNYREESISYGKHAYSIYVQAITGDVTAYYRNKDDSDINLGTLKQGLNTFTPPNDDGFKRLIIVISNGASVTLKYVKVEQSAVATTFVDPNYADELIKCQRYYFKRYYYYAFYSGTANFTYIFSDTVPSMRIKPTVNFANTSNSGLSRAVVSLDTTVKDLTLLIQAVTSKVGNCNVGGTIALDAEIYDDE